MPSPGGAIRGGAHGVLPAQGKPQSVPGVSQPRYSRAQVSRNISLRPPQWPRRRRGARKETKTKKRKEKKTRRIYCVIWPLPAARQSLTRQKLLPRQRRSACTARFRLSPCRAMPRRPGSRRLPYRAPASTPPDSASRERPPRATPPLPPLCSAGGGALLHAVETSTSPPRSAHCRHAPDKRHLLNTCTLHHHVPARRAHNPCGQSTQRQRRRRRQRWTALKRGGRR